MNTVVHWFRQDLRLANNPALTAAARAGTVLPVFILDDEAAGAWRHGSASRWWLYHSLSALNQSLSGRLCCFRGAPQRVFTHLQQHLNIAGIYWNRCYEPWRRQRDSQLKSTLRGQGLTVHSDNGSLLWEPWQVVKADGTPYRVFTPFYQRGCRHAPAPTPPLPAPELRLAETVPGASFETLPLLPDIPWYQTLAPHWQIGETGAQAALRHFLQQGLPLYQAERDFPACQAVSRLSPHLHFGELSPGQIWQAVSEVAPDDKVEAFRRELVWREFSHNLLYHFPELPECNWQSKFDAFPWRQDKEALALWQRGQTGIPWVDAGMRELWQTGFMHNRVRMITASFLVKNLLIDWREGQRWFWDCLVDADLANNSAGWQWVAGSGADAAPYFRIFNPVLQARKFDAQGHYIRRFVSELSRLPDRFLAAPWEAPADVLRAAGVTLGQTYPRPMVDLSASRQAALDAFKTL
ncbi:MAG: deoxyribodipyrimidine photo-lyase [Methylococcales bacterium]|nr:deoxyribodipyrimidine photo-lyase [Methylococcales bacterium]